MHATLLLRTTLLAILLILSQARPEVSITRIYIKDSTRLFDENQALVATQYLANLKEVAAYQI